MNISAYNGEDLNDKPLVIANIKTDISKQSSLFIGSLSANKKKQFEIQTAFDGETEQANSNQWDDAEKEKLAHLREKLKTMKDKLRAHNLAMNLPSRMLKNLDQNKFNLLSDKTYLDVHTHLQEIEIYEKRIKAEKIMQHKETLQKQPQGSMLINTQNIKDKESSETIDLSEQKNITIRKQKIQAHNFNRIFRNLQKQISNLVLIFFNSIPIIQPSSIYKLIWDVLNIVVIIICMFYLPITIIFDFSYTQLIHRGLLSILPNILVLDILINMNTGYFDKGQVVKNRLKIMYFYLRKNFITDIVSVIPFIISLILDPGLQNEDNGEFRDSQQNNSWIQSPIYKVFLLAFFLKGISFSMILKKVEERFNLSKRITNLISLMKLLFTIVLINHLFACVWVYIARIEDESQFKKTWINQANIQNEKWYIKYLTAYYFTTVTMITVGYGDILPRNEVEMILCVITMMLACGVFGYSLNEVGNIFSNFFQVDNEIKKKIGYIKRFMSKKNVNQKLQYQVREYLEYYWRETAEMNQEQEQQIISQLSESLRQKLLYEANKIVFKDSPIFKRNFSKNTMEQIVPLIQEIKFTPESFICLKGVQDDASIYFIENGSVEILLNPKEKKPNKLFTLNKGESFGAHTFFTGLPRINNVRSKEFTTVLKIRRQDFLQLIQSNSEDYETFCNIRDSISYLNDYSKIGLKCISCHSYRHLVNDCQFLHFIPNKPRIIKVSNDLSFNPHREKTNRRKPSKIYYYRNSLAIFREVESQAAQFAENYDSFINLTDEDTQYSDGYFEYSEINENVREEDDNDKNYHLVDKKAIQKNANSNYASSQHNPNQYLYQSRTLKSRGNQEGTQSVIGIDTIEEDEQGENGGEIQNNMNSSKHEKSLIGDKVIFKLPTSASNNGNGLAQILPSRTSQKKPTENQFTVPSIYRTNTNKSDHQNQTIYSHHNSNQNINLVQQSQLTNNGSPSNQEEQQTLDLIGNTNSRESAFSLSPGTFKKNPLKSITKRIMTVQRIFENPKVNERRTSKQIFFDETGSPTASIKQQLLSKQISTEKIMSKFMQTQLGNKTNQNQEHKNFDVIMKQLQQLMINQQNYQELQFIEANNNNNNLDENDEFFILFDKMKLFVKYNPYFNYSSVISRFNQLMESKKKKTKPRRNERNQKQKGTQNGKQSQKNLDLPNLTNSDSRKFSKFSPVINHKPNLPLLSEINDNLSANKVKSNNESDQKEFAFKLEQVQNQSVNIDSMNQMSNVGSSQNFFLINNNNSPFITTDRYPEPMNLKSTKLSKNNSLTIEERFNKQYQNDTTKDKYSRQSKDETVEENDDIGNSPSLHILPNFSDMRLSNMGQRSNLDYDFINKSPQTND